MPSGSSRIFAAVFGYGLLLLYLCIQWTGFFILWPVLPVVGSDAGGIPALWAYPAAAAGRGITASRGQWRIVGHYGIPPTSSFCHRGIMPPDGTWRAGAYTDP